ncbi:MAG: hypothetical protein Ct9H300mP1_25340 [Planctomycetaceae bacterium]|nr:MAG: hypothetical protein Ct9H300mP1_25340 [Planctomycetaceae bacterium]
MEGPVGKFTYEHSIAIDVLKNPLTGFDDKRFGALGHSLGGHGTFFLAPYDDRIKASACNCGASFFRQNPKVSWRGRATIGTSISTPFVKVCSRVRCHQSTSTKSSP